ncbi:hypothetical protein ASPWEDRAFT_28540 [Aspergillus wentii DTO 134E9]|uniref:Uncharacterized protein n=1 Tax=Aspergillus wentii DTO 134E9 TaxID=1073089 RepID=A0A1L9RLY5_ASPWE|nr:uncharacterized protein ASPWEDRAFT_28540 [Aspergillus wentii DTO 134E9]OJJ35946.1 hypothetical protein ASPWEDRAFT_28540 [Aspergillus wentii DTO 134E9]
MDEYQPKVREWADQGLLTPDAILNSPSANIKHFGLLNSDCQQRLHKTFDSFCEKEQNGARLSSQFNVEEAAILLHHSLLYLTRAPSHQPREESSLTEDDLLRVLVRVEYDRSRLLYEESEDYRTRTPADTRRIILQSLPNRVTSQDIDPDKAINEAEHNAFDFPSYYAHRTEFAVTNYDDDGDEMFHVDWS